MKQIELQRSFQQRLTAGLGIVLGLMLLEAAGITVFTIANVHRSLKLSTITNEVIMASQVLDLAKDVLAPLEAIKVTAQAGAERQKYEALYIALDDRLTEFEKLLSQEKFAGAKLALEAHQQFGQMNTFAAEAFGHGNRHPVADDSTTTILRSFNQQGAELIRSIQLQLNHEAQPIVENIKTTAHRSIVISIVLTFVLILLGILAPTLLRGIIRQIRDVSVQLTTAATQLRATAEEQASGATEQSSTVTELSATMEALAGTATNISTHAQQITQASEATFKEMQSINDKVTSTANRMIALGEKSQSIGSITSLIDGLADQTNLLALNAAIEAARAGEAGRGFAVVAAEVRKLAERSTDSTKDIRGLITEIQSETNAVVMGMESATKAVMKGLEQVSHTSMVIKGISMATQQQKSSAEQVAQAVRNVEIVTKEFAASTKQTAASSEQLAHLAEDLKKSIGAHYREAA